VTGQKSCAAFRRAVILSAAVLAVCSGRAQAAGAPIPHGTLELIAEKQWIAAGLPFNLALRFELEKGWHVYWVNPGDSGEPPRVTWDLPAGIKTGAIEWPAPRRLGTPTIVDYGYEDAVTLVVPMHADATLSSQNAAQIAANVKVLVCREMCIPGKAQVSLTLPVKLQPPPASAQSTQFFTEARKAWPRPVPASWKFAIAQTSDSFVLKANLGHKITDVTFFPLAESQVSNASPQTLVPTATGFTLTLRKSDQLLKPIAWLRGILVLSGEQPYSIDVPIGKPGGAAGPISSKQMRDQSIPQSVSAQYNF
jgi:DsbC/DsbD-like thiol-disulfide interchange protein